MINRNSMLYWYPKIKNLKIPQPETVSYDLTVEEMRDLVPSNCENLNYIQMEKLIERLGGYPVFLRTDLASNKHNWENAAFVKNKESLKKCVLNTIEFNLMAIWDAPVLQLVFRKYIPMKNLFTAFHGDMPVNPEIRFFIRDGKILCYHWYWIEDAMIRPSDPNYKQIIAQEKEKTLSNISQIASQASQVAEVFRNDGYWSVDFCLSAEGTWYLIDMATGEKSWHQEGCTYKIGDKKHGS